MVSTRPRFRPGDGFDQATTSRLHHAGKLPPELQIEQLPNGRYYKGCIATNFNIIEYLLVTNYRTLLGLEVFRQG